MNMKRFAIIILLFICNSFVEKGFKRYCNSRFAFCIQYPAAFRPQPPPEDNDGLIFLSPDSKAEIRAFGNLAIKGYDESAQQYSLAVLDTRITYKVVAKDWFVFSGVDKDGNIVYRKTRKAKVNYLGAPKTEVFQTLMITFPNSQKSVYQPYCQLISNSL
jgi:hypothetical protein